ncbi:transposase family protein [Streptomyces chiangmaiensis]|uniref:transposase family protein n=1 Tax=Streptomyces chiangmaiensis TaxID=766497 RepID=UPI00362E5AD4
MPYSPTLPTLHQLTEQHGLAAEGLRTPETLNSLLDALRSVPDPRAAHLVTHPWPMLLGLVACALLCGVSSVRGVIRWARPGYRHPHRPRRPRRRPGQAPGSFHPHPRAVPDGRRCAGHSARRPR